MTIILVRVPSTPNCGEVIRRECILGHGMWSAIAPPADECPRAGQMEDRPVVITVENEPLTNNEGKPVYRALVRTPTVRCVRRSCRETFGPFYSL